jgi:hypothetical protein
VGAGCACLTHRVHAVVVLSVRAAHDSSEGGQERAMQGQRKAACRLEPCRLVFGWCATVCCCWYVCVTVWFVQSCHLTYML